MRVLDAIGHALAVAGSMTWEITWSLILGFTLSAVVQAVVRREAVTRRLGGDGPATLALLSLAALAIAVAGALLPAAWAARARPAAALHAE